MGSTRSLKTSENPPSREVSSFPVISLLKGHDQRCRGGHPWIFSNEVEMKEAARSLVPGSLVQFVTYNGLFLGVGMFNPNSLICGRLLTRSSHEKIDQEFFEKRLKEALHLRELLYTKPYYRLVHAEADQLPGLIIDRFNQVLSCQMNTAGMDQLTPLILGALQKVVAPQAVVLRNDSPIRLLEGLEKKTQVVLGEISQPVDVLENGCHFKVDLVEGQKTGWFFDQRENRRSLTAFAKNAKVLDYYCYTGGFAIPLAVEGASQVIGVDRSAAALERAQASALENKVGSQCSFVCADAFEDMARRGEAGELYDMVIVDPPAFVKIRKDINSGLKGYRKMARLAAPLVHKGGIFFLASCSHHVDMPSFVAAIQQGLADAGRQGRIIRLGGAGGDHPLHPAVPESAYLKGVTLYISH
jgi:23S rRNA (cytosine1962-C5)-methyltransferase